MKTFEQYVNEAEEQLNRRGFLKGLAAFAASAAVPAPVVKMLATPAGVATMPIPAGIALLKGIRNHLDQWDAEDDDDLFDAQEDMAGALGFDYIEADPDADNKYDISATDQMFDLLDLYRTNPELAAAQLIKHLQSVAIDSKDIETSFKSRADDPSDWRYQRKQADAKGVEIAQELRVASLRRRNAPNDNEPAVARSNQIISTLLGQAADEFEFDIDAGIEFWRQLAAQSGREGFDDAQEEIYATLQSYGIDPDGGPEATSGADADSSDLAKITRLAGLAKGASSDNLQEPAPTVKDMGPVQYAKDTPALPAPTKPKFDLTPDLKSKEKVPVQRKGDDAMSEKLGDNRPKLGTKRDQGKSVRKWRQNRGLDESTELSGILKNAGLKN